VLGQKQLLKEGGGLLVGVLGNGVRERERARERLRECGRRLKEMVLVSLSLLSISLPHFFPHTLADVFLLPPLPSPLPSFVTLSLTLSSSLPPHFLCNRDGKIEREGESHLFLKYLFFEQNPRSCIS